MVVVLQKSKKKEKQNNSCLFPRAAQLSPQVLFKKQIKKKKNTPLCFSINEKGVFLCFGFFLFVGEGEEGVGIFRQGKHDLLVSQQDGEERCTNLSHFYNTGSLHI